MLTSFHDLSPLDGADFDALPAWLDDELGRALRAPNADPIGALLATSRLTRAGLPVPLAALDAWSIAAVTPPAAAAIVEISLGELAYVLRWLSCWLHRNAKAQEEFDRSGLVHPTYVAAEARAEEPPMSTCVWWMLQARDDVEGWLWHLGRAAMSRPDGEHIAVHETRLRMAVAGVDELGEALQASLCDAVGSEEAPAPPDLLRMAANVSPAWWLAPLHLRHLSGEVKSWLAKDKGTFAGAPLRILPSFVARAPAQATMSGGSWSVADRAFAEDPGPPIAALDDGRVGVHGLGLDGHTFETPGLIVRKSEPSADAVIEQVELRPPAMMPPAFSKLTGAWWVPLAGVATDAVQLVVALRRGDEVVEFTLSLGGRAHR